MIELPTGCQFRSYQIAVKNEVVGDGNMFENKIKNWLRDAMNLGMDVSDDVTVDVAKANYQKYQDELEQKRKDYIKTICNRIKADSRNGRKSIVTATLLNNDFMTYDFMMEMKEYFEQRGFCVKEESNSSGTITSWLRISW